MKKTNTILAMLISGAMGLSSCGLVENVRQNNRLLNEMNKRYAMCNDGKYDLDTRCMTSESIDTMLNSAYVLKVQAKYEIPGGLSEDDKLKVNGWIKQNKDENGYIIFHKATAIALNNEGYFLTSKYNTKDYIGQMILRNTEDSGYLILKDIEQRLVIEMDGKKYNATVLKQHNDEINAVLLKVDNLPENKKFPKINKANIKEMQSGQLVYQVGNMFGEKIQLERSNLIKKRNSKDKFRIKSHVTFGDIGSPIYLIKDGVPELAGMLITDTPFFRDESFFRNRFLRDLASFQETYLNFDIREASTVLSIDEIVKSLNLKEKGLL